MRVVILTALLPEARAVARAFHLKTRFANQFVRGGEVTVGLVGPGARHLEGVRLTEAQGVIMAGLAGGLSSELRVGDVVMQGACGGIFDCSHRIFRGKIVTSQEIVATPAQKAAIFQNTGAMAVDMETQTVQALAHSLHIPFLAVRAISDTAAQTLDPEFLKLIDTQGRPRLGRALGHLAGHPKNLPNLLRIRRASKVALANLAATLAAIVSSGWPVSCPSPPHR